MVIVNTEMTMEKIVVQSNLFILFIAIHVCRWFRHFYAHNGPCEYIMLSCSLSPLQSASSNLLGMLNYTWLIAASVISALMSHGLAHQCSNLTWYCSCSVIKSHATSSLHHTVKLQLLRVFFKIIFGLENILFFYRYCRRYV